MSNYIKLTSYISDSIEKAWNHCTLNSEKAATADVNTALRILGDAKNISQNQVARITAFIQPNINLIGEALSQDSILAEKSQTLKDKIENLQSNSIQDSSGLLKSFQKNPPTIDSLPNLFKQSTPVSTNTSATKLPASAPIPIPGVRNNNLRNQKLDSTTDSTKSSSTRTSSLSDTSSIFHLNESFREEQSIFGNLDSHHDSLDQVISENLTDTNIIVSEKLPPPQGDILLTMETELKSLYSKATEPTTDIASKLQTLKGLVHSSAVLQLTGKTSMTEEVFNDQRNLMIQRVKEACNDILNAAPENNKEIISTAMQLYIAKIREQAEDKYNSSINE